MSEHASSFRDFGILPENLQPPPEKLRGYYSTGRVIGQYIATGFVSALGLGLIVLFVLTMPPTLSLLGCAAALAGFGTFVYLATHNDYRWVELEGNTLRAQHLYTGRTLERSIEEIDSLSTLVYQGRRIETVVIHKLLGRVKGIEVRFRDQRTPLRILRSDPAMTHAQELIEGILYRMAQVRQLDAEIIDHGGQPLVRNIHWKGEQPGSPPGKPLKVTLACLIGAALMFGAILGLWGLQEQERQRVASVPPHEIALATLIQNGPGSNRHVTLTDFVPGGYAVETRSGYWSGVWVALFPAGVQPEEIKEIKVILSSKTVGDETALRRLLEPGRVTGICSATPRSSWGTTLGPNLVQANHGWPLSAAWSIEELRNPPSAALVNGLLVGSASCFGAVLILAAVLFWKAV